MLIFHEIEQKSMKCQSEKKEKPEMIFYLVHQVMRKKKPRQNLFLWNPTCLKSVCLKITLHEKMCQSHKQCK